MQSLAWMPMLALLVSSSLACSAPLRDRADSAAESALTDGPGPDAGLRGNYGYLTDYACQDERSARDRIDEMVDTFGITDVQFYDWFADYSTPTAGGEWTDPWFHSRQICRQTIAIYIDELHRRGAHAWAYVQSIASERDDLSDAMAGIYPLIASDGTWFHMGGTHPTYFNNGAWARHQVAVWGEAVQSLGFDGIHWDTLGATASDYAAETGGTREFLATAQALLANLGLKQTMNFVNLAWWDDSLLEVVAFPYMEVWSMTMESQLYAAMASPAMSARWGVMAFYPSVDIPSGMTASQVMLGRWSEAPKHHARYLVVGDGAKRLVTEYFAADVPLTAAEIATLASP